MADVARVTLILPGRLWEEVKRLVPVGQRSRVVAEALEAELRRRKRLEQLERVRQFQDYLFDKYGEMPSSVADIHQMREERDAQITGLY
jgi:metal-responsive CopG/Arc/MetJ family transcriptional regulator